MVPTLRTPPLIFMEDSLWCGTAVAKPPHDTPAMQSELPIKVVQGRLGHASIQMTADRYGHLFPRTDDSAELADSLQLFIAGFQHAIDALDERAVVDTEPDGSQGIATLGGLLHNSPWRVAADMLGLDVKALVAGGPVRQLRFGCHRQSDAPRGWLPRLRAMPSAPLRSPRGGADGAVGSWNR
jgi:hypothetical protein